MKCQPPPAPAPTLDVIASNRVPSTPAKHGGGAVVTNKQCQGGRGREPGKRSSSVMGGYANSNSPAAPTPQPQQTTSSAHPSGHAEAYRSKNEIGGATSKPHALHATKRSEECRREQGDVRHNDGWGRSSFLKTRYVGNVDGTSLARFMNLELSGVV